MQGFDQRPSQRSAPSPGPGWTALTTPASDSESEEENENDMLDRSSVPPGPASRGALTKKKGTGSVQDRIGARPTIVSRFDMASSRPTTQGTSSSASSPATVLANTHNATVNAIENSQRVPQINSRNMPPPAFSASQFAKASTSASSSSKVASTTYVPPSVPDASGGGSSNSAKPYAMKQTARKSSGIIPRAGPATIQSSNNKITGNRTAWATLQSYDKAFDKGKGKATPGSFSFSSRGYGNASASLSSSALPPVIPGFINGADSSNARSRKAALNSSDSEDFPDAKQFSAMSQASRTAKKPVENLPKIPKRLPQHRTEGNQSGKSTSTISISASRSLPSTQPARLGPGSSTLVGSISAPLPASQPSSSSKNSESVVVDLSGPEDEETEKQRMEKWKAGFFRKNKGKQVQRGPPQTIDLTLDSPPGSPPRTQMPNKSTGISGSTPLTQAHDSQKSSGSGQAVIEISSDDDPSPHRPRQTARKSTGNVHVPRKSAGSNSALIPQAARKSTGESPRKYVADSTPQTARKATGQSGPSPKPDEPRPPVNHRSPRQTARKSTGQLQSPPTPTLPPSPQTIRKSMGKPRPSQILGHSHNLSDTSNEFLRLASIEEQQPDHDLPKSLALPDPIQQAAGSGSHSFDFRASQPTGTVINAKNAEVAAPAPSTASADPFDINDHEADYAAMDVDMNDDPMPQDDAIPEIELAISEVHLDKDIDNKASIVASTDETMHGKQISKQTTSEVETEGQQPAIGAEFVEASDKMHVDTTSADGEDEEVDALLFSSRSPSRQSLLSSDGDLDQALPNEGAEVDISDHPTADLDRTAPVLTTQLERLDLSSASGSGTPQTTEPTDEHSALKTLGADLLSHSILPTFQTEQLPVLPVQGVREEQASIGREFDVSTLSGSTLPKSDLPSVEASGPSQHRPSSSKQIESVNSWTSALPSRNVLDDVPPTIHSPETLPNEQLPPPAKTSTRSPLSPSRRHTLATVSQTSDRLRSPEQTSGVSPVGPSLATAPRIPTILRAKSPREDLSASPQSHLIKSVNALIEEPKPVRKIKSSLLMNAVNKASLLHANSTPGLSKASTSSLRGQPGTSSLRSQISLLGTKGKESVLGGKPTFLTSERPRSGSASSTSTTSTGDLRTIRQIRSEFAKRSRETDSVESRRSSVESLDQPIQGDSPLPTSELNRTSNPPISETDNVHPTIASPFGSQLNRVVDKDLVPARNLTPSEHVSVSSALAPVSPLVLRKRQRSSSESGHEPGGVGDTIVTTSSRKANKRLRERLTSHSSRANVPVRSSARSHSRTSSTDTADDIDLLDSVTNGVDVGLLVNQAPDTLPESFGREFASVSAYFQAKDLPHNLADVLNGMPKWECSLYPSVIRQAFESAMMSSTTFEEPDAPYIKVINDFDDDIIPPSEFYYTNLMWHGDNVPPPETSKLKGCDCIGKCDPKNRKCSCLQQAQKTCEDAGIKKGFLYDARGRLRLQNYPIYECNELCGCTEDCWNRVVQAGRKCSVNIVKTETKGWGIFAGRKIPSGTFVGIYSGEIITDDEGERRGRIYNNVGRTYLFDIDFWHIKQMINDDDDDVVEYTIDAFHAGNFTRFLNHSCDPNCRINAVYINESNILKPLLAIFTIRDIDAGEELCFSYIGDLDDVDENTGPPATEKKGALYRKCECGARKCVGRLFT